MDTLYVRTYDNKELGTIVNAGVSALVGSNPGVQSIADSFLAIAEGNVPEAYRHLNGYSNSALWISDKPRTKPRTALRASNLGHHVPGTPTHYKHGWIPLVPGFQGMPKGDPKVRYRDLSTPEAFAASDLISQSGNHNVNDPLRHGMTERRPDGSTFFNDPQGVSDEWDDGRLDAYDSLTHSGLVTQDGVTYRGVALPENTSAEEAFPIGSTFTDLGYPSTTTDENWARACAAARSSGENTGFEVDDRFKPTGGDQVIMKIALRKGQPVGPGSDAEHELILPRKGVYQVTGVGKPRQVQIDPDQPPYTQTTVTVEVEGWND